ncbi:MAG: hypothetical protein WCF24_04720 [Acidimicrobiales bacterium]
MITVDFGDEIKKYRNHDVERLVEIIGIGGDVRINDEFVIPLSGRNNRGGYCFSIADAEWDWEPCDDTPLSSMSPDALAARLKSHEGFSVPSRSVLRAAKRSSKH